MFQCEATIVQDGETVGVYNVEFDSPKALMRFSRANEHALGKLLQKIDKELDSDDAMEFAADPGSEVAYSVVVTTEGKLFNEWAVSWFMLPPEGVAFVTGELTGMCDAFGTRGRGKNK